MTPEGNMAPQRSWWSRNWKWAAPVGCIGLIGSCGCLTALLIGLGLNSMKNSTPYEEALNVAKSDSEVQAALGPPIEGSWLGQSSLQVQDGQSHARFSIPLQGTKEHGTLVIRATKSGQDWEYQELRVELEGKPPIDLRDKVHSSPDREIAPPTPDEPPTPEDEEPPPPDDDGKKPGEAQPDIHP